MTLEENLFFELLDNYSRREYKCLLTEMFPSKNGNEYVLCFRPTGVTKGSPDQYACCYLRIDATEAYIAAREHSVTDVIREKLERELPALGQTW